MKKIMLMLGALVVVAGLADDGKMYLAMQDPSQNEIDMSQFVSTTLSRKSADAEDVPCDQKVSITADSKVFDLKDDTFGPLPVVLNVKDGNGKIIYSQENSDQKVSHFKVDVSKLKEGSVIEVLNGFEERQYCRTVTIDQ